MLPYIKPLHTIGKVSVNASIHKAITHYWQSVCKCCTGNGLYNLSVKALHTIGKVSVNASIHKAITHYW